MNKCQLSDNGVLLFECPGCGCLHAVHTEQPNGNGAKWSWNKNLDKPTISPSILVKWNTDGSNKLDKICHSFVRDGNIQFLNDCTHSLSGQTVPLPDME